MKFKIILLAFCFVVCSNLTYGQDTIWYKQKNTVLYSNTIVFMRDSAEGKRGAFVHTIATDDGGQWLGWGTFKENKRSYKLSFSVATPPVVVDQSNSYQSDSVVVNWFEMGVLQKWGNFVIDDTATSEPYPDRYLWRYKPSMFAKEDVLGKTISLYGYFNRKITSLTVGQSVGDTVNVHALHYTILMDTKRAVFTKAADGLRGKGLWDTPKNTLFVIYER